MARSFTIPDLKDDRGRAPLGARVRATRTDTHAFVEEALVDEYGNATFSALPVDVDVTFHATWGGTTTGLKERWFYSHINAVTEGGTGSSNASTARANLGIGVDDSPQFEEIELGHATDTTIARSSAGKVTVEGVVLVRPADYVVAANNAPTHVKAQADYECDATDDHVQIQAAIDALPATGGKVLLSQGTFNIETNLALDSYQTLQGMGRSTILTTTTADLDIIKAIGGSGTEKIGITIADLCIDGNAGSATNDIGIMWDYVDHSKIINVWSIDNGEHGIKLYESDDNILIANNCNSNGKSGLYIYGNRVTVTGNTCNSNTERGIYITDTYDSTVSGNTCVSNTLEGIYSGCFYNSTVAQNTCNKNGTSGMLGAFEECNLSGNSCSYNGQHGLNLTGMANASIVGNTCIGNSQDTDNTYDDIFLVNVDYCLISSNLCRASDETNQPRYGINISNAACDVNTVVNNDLYDDGFGTGSYNDAGTGTIYFAPHNVGIADDNLVEVDGSPATSSLARWTANGLEGQVQTGATFPTSPAPTKGQSFCHAPTGRTILYEYDGANWIPVISVGTMTLYVDKTDGTDQLTDHGTGVDGDAFATIQYAVDCIPGLFGGNVTISVNAEAYSENVTIKGKSPTGSYTITVQGTWAEDVGESTATGGTAGTANTATQATVVKTGAGWTIDAFIGKWVKFEDDTTTAALQGDIRIIESNTADTLSLVGGLDATPANGDTFKIVHPGTTVGNGSGYALNVRDAQNAVVCTILTTASGQGVQIYNFASGKYSFIDCNQGGSLTLVSEKSRAEIDRCYIHGTSHGVICNRHSITLPMGTLIKGDGGQWGFAVYDNSVGRSSTVLATIIDNFSQGGYCSTGGANNWQIGGVPNNVIRNCTTGVLTQLNAISETVTDGNSVSYDTCGTDHSTATGGQET